MKKALLLVDLQNDFCASGSLAVPRADEIIHVANYLQHCFDLVVATQDWHPHDHLSFAVNHHNHSVGDIIELDQVPQILWPVHCVQETQGAEFHPKLNLDRIHKIIHKGVNKRIDSYSAFFDNAHQHSTGLGEYLLQQGVTDVFIMGLATDYCVKFSCLDAVKFGFNVFVITDGCRSVELKIGDTQTALEQIQAAGVKAIISGDLQKNT